MNTNKVVMCFSLISAMFLVGSCTTKSPSDPLIVSRNEDSVVSSMKEIAAAQDTYQNTTGNGNYATLEQFDAIKEGGFPIVSPTLSGGVKDGYRFTVAVSPATRATRSYYRVSAVPVKYGETGVRSFYMDEKLIIRGSDKNGMEATPSDPYVLNFRLEK